MRTNIAALIAIASCYAACGGSQPPAEPPPPVTEPAPTAPVEAPPVEAPKAEVKPMKERQMAFAAAEEKAFNAHDAKAYSMLYAPDAVTIMYGAKGMQEVKGREPIEQMFGGYFTAFPDMKSKTWRIFANDKVAIAQWVGVGTHKGDFMGMKASNKPVGFHGATVVWLDDAGLAKKVINYMDEGTVGGQVGMHKNPVRKPAKLPEGETVWVWGTGDAAEAKNVEMAKAFYAAMEAMDEKKMMEHMAKDGVHVDYTMPADSKGHAGMKAEIAMMKKAFADAKVEAQEAWGFGPNHVVVLGSWTAKHVGPMGPIKATNKTMTMHGLDVMEIKDGKFTKGETYANSMEMMGSLGLLDAPGKGDEKKAAAAKK